MAITSKSYLSLSERMEQNGSRIEPVDSMPEPERAHLQRGREEAR